MATFKNNFLTGKFLVSMPDAEDDMFNQSVIYICSHGKEGAMGFIINKKLDWATFVDLSVPLPSRPVVDLNSIFLHHGGPIEKVRGFVLHSPDYFKNGTFKIDNNVAISSSMDILTDIACGKGPQKNIIAMGYAGWNPQQLEYEIMANRWLVMPSNPEIMFNTPDEFKWERALDETGVDLARFVNTIGHA